MAFITLAQYAKNHKKTRQIVSIKIKKGMIPRENILFLEKVNRYLIEEATPWPMGKSGRPKTKGKK